MKRAPVEAGPVEGPWELPTGWRWERLQDVAEVNPRTELNLSGDEPVTFVPMAAVSEETGVIDVSRTRSAADVAKGFTRFREGDVLFAKITPCMENGKIAEVPALKSAVGAGSTEFHVIRSNAFCRGFVLHYLRQPTVRQQAERNMSGSAGQKRVPTDYLRLLPVPLPPLDTQRRIVARIEELFAEIDEGERALERAGGKLETYRSVLLRAAATGELTADWRPDDKGERPRGATTLAQVLEDHRLRHGRRGARYTPPRLPTNEDLPILPDGWCWVSVEAAGDVLLGRQRAPQHHRGEHLRPYLRVANIMEDRLDLRDVKVMNFTPAEYPTFALQDGDVLLNEGQAPALIGRPAIYRGEIEGCCFQKTLLRFRAGACVEPEFALIVFRHYMRSGRFRREARITTNIGHLTQVRFLPIEFPVPPIAEQREIVDRVRRSEQAIVELLTPFRADGELRQSILAAAFRGDLVA